MLVLDGRELRFFAVITHSAVPCRGIVVGLHECSRLTSPWAVKNATGITTRAPLSDSSVIWPKNW